MLMMVSKSSMVLKMGSLTDLRMELKKDQIKDGLLVQLKYLLNYQLYRMMEILFDSMMDRIEPQLGRMLEQQLSLSSRLDHCNYQSCSIPPLVRNSGNLL
jgi:hypothetical protein